MGVTAKFELRVFFCLLAVENAAQFAFGAFENALLLLWKIFSGAIDVEVQHRHC